MQLNSKMAKSKNILDVTICHTVDTNFKKLNLLGANYEEHIILIICIKLLQSINISCRKIDAKYISAQTKDIVENIRAQEELQDFLQTISRYKNNLPRNKRRSRKTLNNYYESLLDSFDATKFKRWLRQEVAGNVEENNQPEAGDEIAGLVENELLNALSKKSSAILDKPFIQKQGRNDFLVIKSDLIDPFVTIVPNDIYYNVEKKCVNWLDDCNQKGLRERLLQRVNSPYK